MMKVVLKLDMHDDKMKQKAMKTVSGLAGVESISMDSKDKKLTVMGDIDPVKVVGKLRKFCHADILSVGPAKEPEKKKDEGKKDEGPKKAEAKKDAKDDVAAQLMKAYQYQQAYYPQHNYQYPPPMNSYYRSVEEDPNACVIC